MGFEDINAQCSFGQEMARIPDVGVNDTGYSIIQGICSYPLPVRVVRAKECGGHLAETLITRGQ